jgi:hypothetical protein
LLVDCVSRGDKASATALAIASIASTLRFAPALVAGAERAGSCVSRCSDGGSGDD